MSHSQVTPDVTIPSAKQTTLPRLLVIGNGMAGVRTVEEVLKLCPDKYQITIIGAENQVNYNRIMLSPILAGEKQVKDIVLNSEAWYLENNIELIAGDSATHIHRTRKIVTTESGRQVPYDKLILATGSRPNIIPFPGHQLNNVLGFRTLEDVGKMLAASKTHTNAVVIGGGLLGLEAASGLKRQGMQVTVIHSSAFLLNRQIDPNAANLLQQALHNEGVEFAMSARTEKLIGNDEGRVVAVELKDGTRIPADLVIFATGVKPNMELAQSAGIYCEHGILVNDTMQTFDPAIYAVGECVQHRGELFGLVAPLFQQAKVCANHLAELGYSRYQQTPVATKLKVTGIDVYSAGEFLASEANDEFDIITFEDVDKAIYKKLVIKNNVLVGAVLFGDIVDGAFYFDLIQENADITNYRNLLMFGKAFCQPTASEEPVPVQAA